MYANCERSMRTAEMTEYTLHRVARDPRRSIRFVALKVVVK